MRKLVLVSLLAAFAAGSAVAQTPPAQGGPQNPAIKSPDSANRAAAGPVKGANSFTEGEARSRIEDKGYSNVSELKKDDDGIWRGRAMLRGQPVEIALDYQGNVFHGAAARGAAGMTGQGLPTQERTMPGAAGR